MPSTGSLSYGSKTYAYDSLDRLRTRGSTNFTYNDLSNDLVGDGQATYGRDPFGQLLSTAEAATASLAYADQHGDLVASFNPTTTSLTGSVAFDPFGQRTTTTGQQNRIGYQGGWTDPDTGKLNAAARWYDPAAGSFTSRDTWDIPANPSAAANRYGYGAGDPLGNADPTGHVPTCVQGCSSLPSCIDPRMFNSSLPPPCPWPDEDQAPRPPASSSTSGGLHSAPQGDSGGGPSRSGNGGSGRNGQGRSGPSRAERIHRDANTPAPRPKTIHTDTLNDYDRRIRTTPAPKANLPTAPSVNMYSGPMPTLEAQTVGGPTPIPAPGQSPSPTSPPSAPESGSDLAPTPSPSPGTGNTCLPVCDIPWWQNEYLAIPAIFVVIGGVVICISGACEAIAAAGSACVYACTRLQSFGTWLGNFLLGISGGEPSPSARAGSAAKTESETGKVGKAAGQACSLDPETRILLADGTSKKIKDVKLGDEVVAADEVTGDAKGSRKVVALHSNPHDGDLLDVSITDAVDGSRQTIRTTEDHPFWDATVRQWVDAARLTVGHHLISPDGQTVRVQAVRHRAGAATMLNLTIDQLHTYYVMAGQTAVLTHNENGYTPAPKELPGFPKAKRVRPKTPVQGGGGMRARWKDKTFIYERDSQHGESGEIQ